MTLGEMMEQIKNCRYIRHYNPKKTTGEGDDESSGSSNGDVTNGGTFTLENTKLPLGSHQKH